VKILAIGSEGNVGGPLVRYLREVGHEVYTTDIKPGHRDHYSMADINYPIDLLEAFDWEPEVVYLMAAVVSRVTCEQAGSLAVATNLAGTNNVIALTKRVGARLVFFSTSEVYGPMEGIMDEDDSVPCPNNRYGLTKYLGEQLVEYEVREHNLWASTVRPFMIYDENETLGDHRSAMIRFAERLSRGRSIEVHAGSSRSWLHVSDAVRALERMMYLTSYEVVNIGHPDLIETEDLAERIRERLGASPDLVKVVEQPSRMTLRKWPALSKQSDLLGVEPRVSIDEGVVRVCERFL
jgi:nucleoside-diphosphate-sugar epimerase